MMLELRLPHIERGVNNARIVEWLKEPGDQVEPGDDLLVIDTEERVALEIPRNAKLLSKLADRTPTTATRRVNMTVRFRVTSVQAATLRSVFGEVGTVCEVGDLLALLSDGPVTEPQGEPALPLRVVVNVDGIE
jgi:pyruvate/2-oxoglutarate dehydrogenase complex dihydrolipoamide acyltransferase (E2) component